MPKPLNIQQVPSSAQIQFIRQSVEHNIRIDGRTNLTKRKPVIKTNALPHLIGSSYVFYEYEHVEIYTGIKLKLEKCEQEKEGDNSVALEDRLIFEISAMGKVSEEERGHLNRIKHLIYQQYVKKMYISNSCIHKFLTIPHAKKHYLSLHIDCFILGPVHPSTCELLTTGIRQAILSMKTNNLNPTINEVTEEEYIEVTNDQISISELLSNSKTYDPVYNFVEVVGVYGCCKESEGEIVLDMRSEEYESMDACLVMVMEDGKIIYLQSLKGVLPIESMGRISRVVIAQKQKN